MGGQTLHSTVVWLVAAAPLGVLAGVGMLGDVPGEWSRSALLAYASVLLCLLNGMVLASASLPVAAAPPVALGGLLISFVALSLGGASGQALMVAAYAVLVALAWFRPTAGLPWALPLLAALACLIALVRELAG